MTDKVNTGLARTEYLILRKVRTDELYPIFVPVGWRPGPRRGWTWGGPFKTLAAAFKAIGRVDPELHAQLYPEKHVGDTELLTPTED